MKDPHNTLAPGRFFVDEPAAGDWNMAVDEVLLEGAAERQRAALRFYRWSEPTLSLGYFQHARDRERHPPSRDCPLVRRQTGGGAILHDREWTYCLAVPLAHPLAADATRLYTAVHEALRSALAEFGVATTLGTARQHSAAAAEPFLCFQRRTPGDVLFGNSKICGSAQRRPRGAVLQHGSLLLAASPHAPELPGIGELTGENLDCRALVESWASQIGRRLDLELAVARLTESERVAVRALTLEKYGTAAWSLRR